MRETVGHEAWWVIHGCALRGALDRASQGEDPDLLYLELYANSESENFGDHA